MKRKLFRRWIAMGSVFMAFAACSGGGEADPDRDEDEDPREVPTLLRTRFTTEMKAILHDIRHAQEFAINQEGSYVGWEELRRSYLSRSIPGHYRIELDGVSADGYRVEITHGPTGLRCHLAVSGGSGPGSPVCD